MNKNVATKLEIIYEDEALIAINKPAGLLTIPDRFNSLLPSVVGLLKAKLGEIWVVHRLDVGTSGVLLFAKTAEAHKHLNEQFTSHTINKYYSAILEGVLRNDTQEIDIPLLVNPAKKGGIIPSSRGKESITILTVENRYRNGTLVKAELKTGRQHQLRVHTATIGYPLLVDELYGNNSEFYVSTIKRKYNIKKNEEEKPIISRPTMHARELHFFHLNGEKIILKAEYPKDFVALLQVLDKYGK